MMAGKALDEGCVACGWTHNKQSRCCYSSHVKLIYGAHDRGVWSIGTDLILKERPDDGPKDEAKTLKLLASYTNIPAPELVCDWVDRNRRYFVLQKRMDGETLEDVWPILSHNQRVAIADQVAGICKHLHSITSSRIQSVDQTACSPALLFFDFEPRGPFHSDLELWDAISLTLHNPPERSFPQQALDNLKKRFPKCAPYVLTHCDLNIGNIMVKDGQLVGILDWEYAAYYPIWYEYVSATWGFTEADAEWRRLLRQRLDTHEDAKNFWMNLYHLRNYPDLDEKGREVLENLSAES
jgi:aminoglycoside phosphotransferase (APT) family kinase protein